MVLGIVTAIFFLAECSLFLWNRYSKKRNLGLIKIHCIGGFATLILACLHFVTVLKLWKQRPLLMNVSGCMMLGCMAVMCILFLIKRKQNRMTIHRILAGVIFLMLGIHIYGGITSLSDYRTAVSDLYIENVNISEVPDGVYEGECNVGYIYARVSVTVSEGVITEIKILEHRNERGTIAERITDSMISRQEIKVDTVTSATNSSKVIQKAVENALIMQRNEG